MSAEFYLNQCGLSIFLERYNSLVSPNQKRMYNIDDLAFIHQTIRRRKPFTTLEFGVGFSSLAIAHALMLNKSEFEKIDINKNIRNSKMFKHYIVDSNQKWIDNTMYNFPEELIQYVCFNYSEVEIKLLNDFGICSLYKKLPNIVPEFIYLDGPDPKDVTGDINGISFDCPERTIIS
jgi:hypothetical protein